MKFSLNIGMCDPIHSAPMAQKVEACGYDGIAVADSICYPTLAEDYRGGEIKNERVT